MRRNRRMSSDSIPDRFAAAVASNPERLALRADDSTVTFDQLHAAAHGAAAELARRGVAKVPTSC